MTDLPPPSEPPTPSFPVSPDPQLPPVPAPPPASPPSFDQPPITDAIPAAPSAPVPPAGPPATAVPGQATNPAPLPVDVPAPLPVDVPAPLPVDVDAWIDSPHQAEDFNPPGDASIVGSGLLKRYGLLNAVNEVDFYVPRGSVYGLIGPNGAGKSTLMSMVASLLLPTGGRLLVEGHDPISDPAAVRRKIGYMPDGLGVYEGMNVAEYIEFFASAYRIDRDLWTGLTDTLLELVELEVKRTAPVNSLSRGMKQRLSLARALVHDPDLLILDEPASGLDPRARIELRRLIENLNSMGKTVLVSSHILTELQEVCTHVGIMEAGRLLASGSPAEILEQTRVRQRVLAVFADGTTQEYELDGTTSRSDLLRRLVLEDPREVVEYRDVSQGLEDVFLSVTQGIVQ